MRDQELFDFIWERHRIWERRRAGQEKPWTKDKILQRYRFCNVYRELDTVTQWIAKNWREPHSDDPFLFFAMVVARLVNWPESLEDIGYPVPWDPQWFVETLDDRKMRKAKVFTGAYMVRADANKTGSKARYLADHVLTPIWKDRNSIRPRVGDSLQEFYDKLSEYRDMGSFMVGQVIADLKYVPPLDGADDWYTWAVSGPGSRRGLNLVVGREVDAPWKEKDWWETLHKLHRKIERRIEEARMPELHAQDLQNCLCEYLKYCRGCSRSKYPGV